MKKAIAWLAVLTLIFSGCTGNGTPPSIEESEDMKVEPPASYSVRVTPETLAVSITVDDVEYNLSRPGPAREVSGYIETTDGFSWEYPGEELSVEIRPHSDYLDVTIYSQGIGEADFQWPLVEGDSYTLPLGEGKRFAADDPVWTGYLGGSSLNTLESLSMAFFAVGTGDHALLYILADNFDNELVFEGEDTLRFALSHTFPSVNPHRSYNLRVYPVENDPVAIAKIYKDYIEDTTGIKTLRDKERENPEVAKIYGAAHFYLFDTMLLSEEDVNWPVFQESMDASAFSHIRSLSEEMEDAAEFLAVLEAVSTQDYVDGYQRTVVIRGLSELLCLDTFWNDAVFPGLDNLPGDTHAERMERNKQALFQALPGAFAPVDGWADDRTVDLINGMEAAGIEYAWLGLDDWNQALGKPALVERIAELGWLVGPYDSYHSIHPYGEEQWHTAAFPVASLYDEATVVDASGEYLSGFQGVGRKLNPTLAFPQVQNRVEEILANGAGFNSWFVDCDATGEVYNDYAASHPTTRQQDVAARLERMEWLNSEKGMVVGSEGGNDYAANAIVFAHGLELQSFAWMDEDMRSNRESEYYLGRYYAPGGGAPEKMTKQVPVKEEYKAIFLNPAYNVPLYKLVYNNAVITSYHWEWSTLKIAGEVGNRQLYEMLYNVPPMYHLDKLQWEEHGTDIATHVREWSAWSRQVIHEEMTDFQVLSEDGQVQLAAYGEHIIVVNWSDADFDYQGTVVEAKGYHIL